MAALYASDKKSYFDSIFSMSYDKSTGVATVKLKAKSTSPSDDGVYFYKEESGSWRWLGIVSNNRLDRHEEIITSKGHKYFVNSIDSGLYTKMMGIEMPELWVWHVPVPIGTSEVVSYDERGFLISAGKQYEGEFYSKIFEKLSKVAPTLGMSHSFPAILTRLDSDNLNHIIEYMAREFTVLPLIKAANWLTGGLSIEYKEMVMDMLQIPEHKREWFKTTFGEDMVAEFDRRLEDLGKAADAVGLPKKEFDMQVEQSVVTEETVVDQPVAEVPEVIEEVTEVVEDVPEEEGEEVLEPVVKTGMTPTEFYIPKEALDEIVAGVKAPFDLLLKEVQSANARLVVVEKELASIKKGVIDQEKEIESRTPYASLAGQLAKSIIGSEAAQVDYNKERDMYNGPEETHDKQANSPTGISFVDEAINRQRNRRVVRGSVLSGQQ